MRPQFCSSQPWASLMKNECLPYLVPGPACCPSAPTAPWGPAGTLTFQTGCKGVFLGAREFSMTRIFPFYIHLMILIKACVGPSFPSHSVSHGHWGLWCRPAWPQEHPHRPGRWKCASIWARATLCQTSSDSNREKWQSHRVTTCSWKHTKPRDSR